MLVPASEHVVGNSVRDAAKHGELLFAALEDAGLVVIERGVVVARHELDAAALVPSDDGRRLLALSPLQGPYTGLRRIVPPEEHARTRRVWVLSPPWTAQPVDLGVVPADGWTTTFDGHVLATFEADDLHVFRVGATHMEHVSRHETFGPIALARIPAGLWLETSSLGASHFEQYSMPHLTRIDSGDLGSCDLAFPPEIIRHYARSPAVLVPVFSVDAAGVPVSVDAGQTLHHPRVGDHRVVTLDDRLIATLPVPSSGLIAANHRALVWVRNGGSMEFLAIDLRSARVTSRFVLDGVATAGARITGPELVVWDDRGGLRVFVDLTD
jgi:hypothetical protein